MLYALLVYADQAPWAEMSEEEATAARAESMPRWITAFAEIERADPNKQGFELESATEARAVRIRHGERIVTDGPSRRRTLMLRRESWASSSSAPAMPESTPLQS